SSEIVNHAPLPLASAMIDPSSPSDADVIFCRATPGSLYRGDPDYDIVRYRYVWTVNGATVRDVTSAALSDAIPKVAGGSGVRCTVTPMDETTAAASASATATVGGTAAPPP